jgi:hypothetical protein
VRVRLVVAVGLVLIAGAHHTNQVSFVATVPGGSELCQPLMELPPDAAQVQVLIGTYGRPVPSLSARFVEPPDRVIASGTLTGAKEGLVKIPLTGAPAGAHGGTLCIGVGQGSKVVFAGDVFTAGPDSVQVNRVPSTGRITVTYLRPGKESWWQLLGALSERFGFGKASFFGSWTLALMALLLLGVWVATVRLLLRELT